MKRALIVLAAMLVASHTLAAQIEIRTKITAPIGTIATLVPVLISTPALKFTGTRFMPKTLATAKLAFTGTRWVPVTLKTGPIVFTGMRWIPVTVRTSPIVFTGTRKTRLNGVLR